MPYRYHPNSTYFVTYKTYHSLDYFQSDSNKKILHEQMIKACEKFDFNLITYVILSNHYHLLIETQDKTNLNKAIQIINGGSAFLIDKPSQTKQVWQRANKNSSAILNEESFFSVLGYIVGNPLKHGIVKDFDELNEYRFCNYIEQINEHSKGLINDLILKNCKLDFESPESFERIYGSA